MKINTLEIKRNLRENRYVRAALAPIRIPQKKKIREEYAASQWPEDIRKFKDCHKGKRCFIIGNGPSLTPEDLDMIKDEFSIAANKIYNIYDRTEWRPTYYICEDNESIIADIGESLDKLESREVFLSWAMHDKIHNKDNFHFCCFNPYYVVNLFNYSKTDISEDLSKYFGWACTVTFSAIQLAIYMGFSEIYLLGVDFSYPYYRDAKGRKHFTGDAESHFAGGAYKWTNYMVKVTNENGYNSAREYCDSHNILIKNLTRGGKLEAFERESLENIISK